MKIKRFKQLNEEIDNPKDPMYRKSMYIELIRDTLKMFENEIQDFEDSNDNSYIAELYDLNKDLLETAQMFGSREEELDKLVQRLEKINIPY